MGRKKGSKNPEAVERYREIGKKNGAKTREAAAVVAQKRAGALPIYANPALLAYRLARYMHTQDRIKWSNSNGEQRGKPYTIAGAKVAAGLYWDQWDLYAKGEKDKYTEEVRAHGPMQCRDEIQDLSTDFICDQRYIPYTMLLLGDPEAMTDGYKPTPEHIQEQADKCFLSDVVTRFALIVEGQREQDLYDKGRTTDIFIHKARYGWQDETVITSKREIVTSAEARELLDQIIALPEYKG